MAKRNMPTKKAKVIEEIVEETIEVNETPEPITGIVSGCGSLNIRSNPNLHADIVCQVKVNTNLAIDANESVDGWYKVCTESGVEGFCMSKYITIKK